MDRMRKHISLVLILFLAVVSLLLVETTLAQSTKPSAPKYNINFPNNSTIDIVIENQIFTKSNSVNSIIYYYRVKDHYSEQWITDKNYQLQSEYKTTTITIPSVPGPLFPAMIFSTILNNSTLIDFQVQAQTGYYAIANKSGPPVLISPAPQRWHTEITFNESATSEWSSTLTVDINKMDLVTPITIPANVPITSDSSPSPSSTLPNMGPTSSPIPNNADLTLTLTLIIATISVVIIVSLLLYVMHLKRNIAKK